MTRLSLFDSPFLLGFDQLEHALDRVSKSSSDGYPPYNIEKLDDRHLRITLAVAGFSPDDLSISVEDRQLVIRGQHDTDSDRQFLHRGIATRQFQRTFVIAEGIEVTGADMSNGLLHVDLVRPEVESRRRTIEINGSGASKPTLKSVEGAAREAS